MPPLASGLKAALAALLVTGATLLSAGTAAAHPHVWVMVATEVVYEKGSIVAFRHRWTFDEYYTAMAIEGLDKNGDGQYSRDELAELAKVNMDGLKEFGFFTFPKLGGQPLGLVDPKEYWLEASLAPKPELPPGAPPPPPADPSKPDEPARVLTLVFTLPLQKPVLADARDFTFSIEDPSFFIAFELTKPQPVKLVGAPQGCKVDLGGPEPDPAAAPQKPAQPLPADTGGPMTITPMAIGRAIHIGCPSR